MATRATGACAVLEESRQHKTCVGYECPWREQRCSSNSAVDGGSRWGLLARMFHVFIRERVLLPAYPPRSGVMFVSGPRELKHHAVTPFRRIVSKSRRLQIHDDVLNLCSSTHDHSTSSTSISARIFLPHFIFKIIMTRSFRWQLLFLQHLQTLGGAVCYALQAVYN